MDKRLAYLLGLGLLLAVLTTGCSVSVGVPPPGYLQVASGDTVNGQGGNTQETVRGIP
jgi:hypothetical protein